MLLFIFSVNVNDMILKKINEMQNLLIQESDNKENCHRKTSYRKVPSNQNTDSTSSSESEEFVEVFKRSKIKL